MLKPRRCKKKFVLGLTGIFGSGKTTVAGMLKALGARVVDADALARPLLRRNRPAYQKALRAFGKEILGGHREIDRRKLARLVFSDKGSLKKLNAILHPEIIRLIKKRIRGFSGGVIVLDAPLLIEAGLGGLADKIAVVKISGLKQRQRLSRRDALTAREIALRTKSQISQSRKILLADFVIDNSDSMEKTKKQVKELWRIMR